MSAATVGHAEVSARRAAARGLRVRAPMSVAEWAGRYRVLASEEGPEPGRFDLERIPYLRGIMDALDDSHRAERVIFEKSSQTGGTTIGQNWLGWTIHQSPAPLMVLMPTVEMSLYYARSRLHPMLSASPALRAILPPGRKADVTLAEKHYPGGAIYFGSANKANDLSGKTVQRVLLDEVDRFPREIKGEGDVISLAQNRMATYVGRRKMFANSTPTDESSLIDREYEASSRGRYFVPCPHCETMQVLEWGNVDWPVGRHELARYRCVECAALIDEHHKTAMLAGGEWRHERPELCDSVIGFHISGLYTPIGLGYSWAAHAKTYDGALHEPAMMLAFVNTHLGKIQRSKRVRLEGEDVQRRREAYQLRTIPPGVLLLTAGVDVQVDRVEAQVVGWGRGERMTVVDYAILPGDPTRPDVWTALDNYLAAALLNSFGVAMRITCALVDSGNWQNEVLGFTRGLRARNVFASKGSSRTDRVAIGRPTKVDVNYRGRLLVRGAEQYQIGVHALKNTLFARLRADAKALPADRLIRFPEALPDAYFEQLTAEIFDPAKGRWIAIRDRNESLDTMLLAMAAAMHHSAQVHRLRELDWQRLEQLYERQGGPVVSHETAPLLGKTPVAMTGGFLPTAAVVRRQQ